ncbi:GntR family transcriptional regulator [Clostridium thailandense]|uniref:GntR family transcriptional regulator n=1 Tax=Clostridium thailandense TaxID=2794346 RepID=UPI003988BFF0
MNYEERIAELIEKHTFISKTDVVYTLLLEDIIEGRLKGGSRLNQEDLSMQFGISRSPVREALNRLASDGYLVKSNASGYRVYDLRLEDYISLNEFRNMMESFGSSLAVKNITGNELDILKRNIEETKEAVEKKDTKAFLHLDEEFHGLLIEAGKNPHLIETYNSYGQRFHLFGILTLSQEMLAIAYKWHVKILQAVISGNAEEVAKTTRLHREATINSALRICRDKWSTED